MLREAARVMWDAFRHGDVAGLGRTSAIIIGWLVTTLGFISGKIQQGFPARPAAQPTET